MEKKTTRALLRECIAAMLVITEEDVTDDRLDMGNVVFGPKRKDVRSVELNTPAEERLYQDIWNWVKNYRPFQPDNVEMIAAALDNPKYSDFFQRAGPGNVYRGMSIDRHRFAKWVGIDDPASMPLHGEMATSYVLKPKRIGDGIVKPLSFTKNASTARTFAAAEQFNFSAADEIFIMWQADTSDNTFVDLEAIQKRVNGLSLEGQEEAEVISLEPVTTNHVWWWDDEEEDDDIFEEAADMGNVVFAPYRKDIRSDEPNTTSEDVLYQDIKNWVKNYEPFHPDSVEMIIDAQDDPKYSDFFRRAGPGPVYRGMTVDRHKFAQWIGVDPEDTLDVKAGHDGLETSYVLKPKRFGDESVKPLSFTKKKSTAEVFADGTVAGNRAPTKDMLSVVWRADTADNSFVDIEAMQRRTNGLSDEGDEGEVISFDVVTTDYVWWWPYRKP
jgi:hypothetical protein